MPLPSKSVQHSSGEDRARYGIARARSLAYSSVVELWRKRQQQDKMTQAEFAARLNRDTGWLSKKLAGPGNWTLKTFARMVEALDGEIEIRIHDLREPSVGRKNFDAYDADQPAQHPAPQEAPVKNEMINVRDTDDQLALGHAD